MEDQIKDETKTEEQIKLENLEALKQKGIDPYPDISRKNAEIKTARQKIGEKFWLAGRVTSIREHGKSTFADLVDQSGKIQIYFKTDKIGEENYETLKLIDTGDFIEVDGEVFETHAGEITLMVEEYRLLTKSLAPLPKEWYGVKDVEIRYRKRFLDFVVNEQAKKTIATRSKAISFLRSFMEGEGFVEIETPILQPIPGGASAKPFVTHYNILEHDFYLRIAPELYLKRLVAGGFEKVYEIGRCFRNEGLSHMHNPEFTMFEFYWAYKDYKFLMEFSEKLVSETVKAVTGNLKIKYGEQEIDFTPPYERVTFAELVERDCGININNFREFEALKNEIEAKGIKLDLTGVTVWTKLVDELYKSVSRPKISKPIFIIDYPVELYPLAKKKPDDEKVAECFQLVCGGGLEVIKAYTELNDPIDQEGRFKDQVAMREAGWDEGQLMDQNFVDALKTGMPPTAGWGMGIDRFLMLITDNYSIKEVIPFPTLRPEEKN